MWEGLYPMVVWIHSSILTYRTIIISYMVFTLTFMTFSSLDPWGSIIPLCSFTGKYPRHMSQIWVRGWMCVGERSDVLCERTSSTDTDQMCSATGTLPNYANPELYYTRQFLENLISWALKRSCFDPSLWWVSDSWAALTTSFQLSSY